MRLRGHGLKTPAMKDAGTRTAHNTQADGT
jgi:hypothetical protein